MEFLKKVSQRLRQVRAFGRFVKEDGLINTTDLLVATAATVVLAAGVGGTVLSTLDESKYGKAQPDAQAIGQAIMSFYKDTGKWPGQAIHANGNYLTTVLLATGPTVSGNTASQYTLPSVANNGLDHGTSSCAANSGQGFVNGSVATANFSDTTTTAEIPSSVLVLN